MNHLLKNQNKVLIVSGGAKGADSLAERYAKEMHFPLIVFPAEWDKYGKSAGYKRNELMHQYISHFKKRGCAAFWDGVSKGTASNFSLAKKYGNDIKKFLF